MERKYYFSRGTEQFGPLSLDELDNEKVTPDMLFWYQGLPNWKKGHELPELSPIFNLPPPILTTQPPSGQTVTPPPLPTTPVSNMPTGAAKPNSTPWIIGGIVVLLGIFLLIPKQSEEGSSEPENASMASDSSESTYDPSFAELMAKVKAEQAEEKNRIAKAREDSIAQARADSIANERRLRLIEEDKQRKLLDATEIIKSFSSSLMKRVSPATGKDLNYNILYDESTYDELTSTMNVVFETSWNAVAAYDFGPTEKHILKGKIIVYSNGETRQETIFQNDVLVRAIKANSAANDIMDWLEKNSKKSSDQ